MNFLHFLLILRARKLVVFVVTAMLVFHRHAGQPAAALAVLGDRFSGD